MDIFGDRREERALEEMAEALKSFAHAAWFFNKHFFAASDFQINSVTGDMLTMISPVQAGSSRQYRISLVPSNAAPLSSGPTVSSSNPLVTLTQDAADPFLITAAADATVTDASFNCVVNGVNSANNPITHTFLIPITQAPPPVALDFDLNDA